MGNGGLFYKSIYLLDKMQSEKTELLEIKTIKTFADEKAAVATFTLRQKFTYDGNLNEDIALYSMVLEKQSEGGWRIVHEQRATGQQENYE